MGPAMVRLHDGVRSAGEGVFGALALAPAFAAKLPTGLLGGYLLQTHCPAAPGGDCPLGAGGGRRGCRGCRGCRGWDEMRRSGAVGTVGLVTLTSAGSHGCLPPMAQGQR